jgi:hypothetical protein
MEEASKPWHLEVISPEIAGIARRLSEVETLQHFYLAGGTALGLYFGHRRSVDLDFFNSERFTEDVLIAAIQSLPEVSVISKSSQTVYLRVSDTKVSFIWYGYPLLFPLQRFEGLAIADAQDIACMKISALAGRGSRRDFVDLYVAAREYGLQHLLDLFQRKFAQANYSSVHLRKALTYFEDAEQEPIPDILATVSWEKVKELFVREVPKLRIS